MLLTDEEIQVRMESPGNLLNRLKRASHGHSPLLPPPTSKDIIPDIDDKLKGDVKKQAARIMSAALTELEQRIPDINKPEKLAQIAEQMNKVLVAREDKVGDKAPQVIVYAPQVIQESHFPTIVVNEDSI